MKLGRIILGGWLLGALSACSSGALGDDEERSEPGLDASAGSATTVSESEAPGWGPKDVCAGLAGEWHVTLTEGAAPVGVTLTSAPEGCELSWRPSYAGETTRRLQMDGGTLRWDATSYEDRVKYCDRDGFNLSHIALTSGEAPAVRVVTQTSEYAGDAAYSYDETLSAALEGGAPDLELRLGAMSPDTSWCMGDWYRLPPEPTLPWETLQLSSNQPLASLAALLTTEDLESGEPLSAVVWGAPENETRADHVAEGRVGAWREIMGRSFRAVLPDGTKSPPWMVPALPVAASFESELLEQLSARGNVALREFDGVKGLEVTGPACASTTAWVAGRVALSGERTLAVDIDWAADTEGLDGLVKVTAYSRSGAATEGTLEVTPSQAGARLGGRLVVPLPDEGEVGFQIVALSYCPPLRPSGARILSVRAE